MNSVDELSAPTVSFSSSTTDYDIFTNTDWNRNVDKKRKENIKQSIAEIGQIEDIIVNEFYEVVNGQGRLAACKELGIPVKYKVVPGARGEHCIAVNAVGKQWSLLDYIRYFRKTSTSEENRKAYEFLEKYYYSEYANVIGRSRIFNFSIKYNNEKSYTKLIKSGKAKLRDKPEEILKLLDYLVSFKESFPLVGNKDGYLNSLVRTYFIRKINHDDLKNRVKKYQNKLHGVRDVNDALEMLEEIYNYKKSNRIDFFTGEKKAS